MELLKRKVQQITTTGSTSEGIIIIPDTSVSYNFNILLKSNIKDWGFFDVLNDEDANVSGLDLSANTYVVTGNSKSRLSELKKFSTSTDLSIGYINSTSSNIDGVNTLISNNNDIIYYIGGITYNDIIENNSTITSFSFLSSGYSSPNFINLPIIKDESKQNIIDKPEVDNDVFIIRQSLPVFQNIYRLQDIKNINDLEKYAGGGKFSITNNT